MVETTALGAAGLAGLALGVWRSSAEFLAGRRFPRFEPVDDAGRAADAGAGWARAVARRWPGRGPAAANWGLE